jgi:hypothetical protein
MAYIRICLAVGITAMNCIAAHSQKGRLSPLPQENAALVAEAFHLWKSLGNDVWPGWSQRPIPVLLIGNDVEYAIAFPANINGFRPVESSPGLDKINIQARKRTLELTSAAAFDVEGVNAVVIGLPGALAKSPTQWVLTAIHEMFHVWQYENGSGPKVRELNIGPSTDASWQISFPFPYDDEDLVRLIHLQSYLTFLAINDIEESDARYNARVALEAVEVYRSFLLRLDPTGRSYKYSQFQQWDEGIAFYTEYKMAQIAASAGLKSTEPFRALPGFKSYQELWDENYKSRVFLVKHAGRAARSRTTFYHLGLGKGLLLDRLLPGWKARYFTKGIWLDELIVEALGNK